jgi:hypothetical protein
MAAGAQLGGGSGWEANGAAALGGIVQGGNKIGGL